ncbi:MAG: hypothetical protein JXB35_04725, partial [Anaerolineae bacterium]|nr:hypothetical protein [Anaerolineae bacterium]
PVQTPGSLQGNRYEFVDETVAPGATYAYWLETVDARGAQVRHGPASATAPLNRAYQIYLPVIRR